MYGNVLITGGTGYLGRALVKRFYDEDVERICIYSRGEYAQAVLREAILDPHDNLRWFIGDVRDKARLRRAMQGIDLVIHTAALKRVEVGEYNPTEMVQTNVLGTMNVLEAAEDAHVERLVYVSSDKACQPMNAYGATKLVGEKLTLAPIRGAWSMRCAAVRYGNVAGSTGSVIPTWRALLAAGATAVPVRAPQATRFWLTIQEAVELVLWTADHMLGGELVVPLMPAYRVGDLAQAMGAAVRLDGGLGTGEKLDEMMIAPLESPRFRHVPPYLVAGGLAESLDPNMEGVSTYTLTVDEIRERLKEIR